MKKLGQVNIRTSEEEQVAFRSACSTAGVKASAVIRDLCKAAVPYMESQCRDGRWRPPVLITEAQAVRSEIRAEVVQEHNGRQNVKRKRR